MKHIERYLSAYAIYCLFGGREDEHLDYVMTVLRESSSTTTHPVLSKILDYVRQSLPDDVRVQEEVAQYLRSLLCPDSKPAPEWTAQFFLYKGIVVFKVYHEGDFCAAAMADANELETAIKELKQRIPGIQILQIHVK